jgi:P22_AR N-terminal domain/ORF6C domain
MTMDSSALVPTDVRSVDFYGDQVTGAVVASGEIYVPMRPICDYLGLDWSSQRQRINRDNVLAEGVVVITIPSAGGPQNAMCLPLDLLPGWLFGISTSRVKPDLQEKITRYRRECFRVLWEAFKPEILGSAAPTSPSGQSGAQIAYEMATAIQHLARQQLDFEQRLDRSAHWAKTIEARVSGLELQINPGQHISDAEAAELAGAVKNVAAALGGHSAYGSVYSELYRRFGISTYKNLPHRRLQEALDWLKAWYDETSAKG